jgi:G6PDH family F420-dependent oxidoreductase
MNHAPATFGYAISTEEHDPAACVRNARMAEDAGFGFLSVTDHYHPWVAAQGQASFVWSLLGALASATDRIRIATGVACPLIRMHPAVVAQAAATTAILSDGRFWLGVGSGEALNEHVTGERWPPPDLRLRMLDEAVAVIRELWRGETVDHHGEFYTVENARLFSLPDAPPPVIVSALGPEAATHAARIGDGLWCTGPKPDIVGTWREAGGQGPRVAQLNLCWAADAQTARETVLRVWPNPGIPGLAARDLPTWSHFDELAETIPDDAVLSSTPAGPDPGPVLESVHRYLDAGFDHIYFHQVGPDQSGFLRFWQRELAPALRDRRVA